MIYGTRSIGEAIYGHDSQKERPGESSISVKPSGLTHLEGKPNTHRLTQSSLRPLPWVNTFYTLV